MKGDYGFGDEKEGNMAGRGVQILQEIMAVSKN